MTDWTVTVDATVAGGLDEDDIDNLLNRLAAHGASISVLGQVVGATLTVTGQPDPLAAARAGIKLLLTASPGATVHGVEAITVEEADRRLDEPSIPELVGASEAANLLGVSRQRVHQLHTANQAFPQPVVEVRMGPLWTRASVEAFERAWTRTPGRPAGAVADESIPARAVADRRSTKNGTKRAATRGAKVDRAAVSGKATGRRSRSSVRGSA